MFAPYQALANRTTQFEMLPVVKELFEFTENILANPDYDLRTVPYLDASKTSVLEFAKDVEIADHFQAHLSLAIDPERLPADERAAYHQEMRKALHGWAKGLMKKLILLTDVKYGGLLLSAFGKKKMDPRIKDKDASSTFQERCFAQTDEYMRRFPKATPYHVHSHLISADMDLASHMLDMLEADEKHFEEVFSAAMRIGEEMHAIWKERLAGDEETIAEGLRQHNEKLAVRKLLVDAELAQLTLLDRQWKYSEKAFDAEINRLTVGKGRRRPEPAKLCGTNTPSDYCKIRCVCTDGVANSGLVCLTDFGCALP